MVAVPSQPRSWSPGQMICGAVVSTDATRKSQLDELPAASVAVQCAVASQPRGITVPTGGVHTTVALPQASFAVAVTPSVPPHSNVWFEGHEIAGAVLSGATVTV